ncbi:MAG: biotin--[acetyl-CoA-carboxylase] ligase [Gammaproteobacteria bacterium]|nr:biotin--[acetyl-CoA-carboxylase] ligase [Gammaproteobacteria bacterium]NIM73192.1 biotin--[acetyl-CoA-carboxylase] ligase [Gammaproteobacteria bacterium]NIN40028.1 biotin--[acetyl-CoA-carboxylase] ligase [Gammaproteobacteria bacterium]NIO26242.1 biotin--[acetyl-CoA-carboxylase] ligase [Gammaproteobacteria bacterium]NIO66051.1 biotin--[acetyl-CoA-carboxylase] ligase [Gammaproteobacteria bacterium]
MKREHVELLDQSRILDAMPAAARRELGSLTVLDEVDSTNRFLMQRAAPDAAGIHACVAEAQTAGRGRRGRPWVSPSGANLYLSVVRAFATAPQSLQGLSLATGVAVARALASLGVAGIMLKWPNDVLLEGCKLGGILLETTGTGTQEPVCVVTGIGLNVDMPDAAGAGIDQPWTDLARSGSNPGRNRLAAHVLAELLGAQRTYIDAGFEAFSGEWRALDALRDCVVELDAGAARRSGIARGVDASGALLIEIGGRCERVLSAEVSLRSAR